ncbi:MAG TPA: hypothetical protein VI362_05175 [Ignavibacteriaceae bacterium]|nr:hypothetical protein [Ignavibacteriaceae bacterium]
MIIASIDIGTNTVLLLIAEVNLTVGTIVSILNEYRMPRIGKGLTPGENISDTKIDELFSVLADYKSLILECKCDKILITATNALRIASNSNEIKKQIKATFDFDVDIISGDQEAEYAFLGALSGSNQTQYSLVIDIGGGSTELIYGNYNNISFKKSFQIGSVSATEKYFMNALPSTDELNIFMNDLIKIFSEIKNKFRPDNVIAVAGTSTTLVCMKNNLKDFDESIVEGSTLSRNDLLILIDIIAKLNPEQIRNKFGSVMKGREDIILAGAIILKSVMELIELNEITVSSRGTRYGAIVNYMRKGLN